MSNPCLPIGVPTPWEMLSWDRGTNLNGVGMVWRLHCWTYPHRCTEIYEIYLDVTRGNMWRTLSAELAALTWRAFIGENRFIKAAPEWEEERAGQLYWRVCEISGTYFWMNDNELTATSLEWWWKYRETIPKGQYWVFQIDGLWSFIQIYPDCIRLSFFPHLPGEGC